MRTSPPGYQTNRFLLLPGT